MFDPLYAFLGDFDRVNVECLSAFLDHTLLAPGAVQNAPDSSIRLSCHGSA